MQVKTVTLSKARLLLISLLFFPFILLFYERAYAFTLEETIFSGNGYITMSPDGNAFTVGYRDQSAAFHGNEYMGYTHVIFGNLEGGPLSKGQHYYTRHIEGRAPVGYWKIEHPYACCIHTLDYYDLNAYGLSAMGATYTNCGRDYNAGWNAYCAYCGERINTGFIYMTEEMAASLPYLPSGTGYSSYFYLCPYDNSLEVTGYIDHTCKRKSNNRYRISYDPDMPGVSGYMSEDTFYYDNAGTYEGNRVYPAEYISGCGYSKSGYSFIGWATSPGGEAVFDDGESWLNIQNSLSIGDFANDTCVVLYAVWRPEVSTERPYVDDGENVYIKDTSTFYVRADGITPFTVSGQAYLKGSTDSSYMINDIWLYENDHGGEYHYINIKNSADGYVPWENITAYDSAGTALKKSSGPYASRSDNGRVCRASWNFTVPAALSGQEVTIVPKAGAVCPGKTGREIYSSVTDDRYNSIRVIFDGERPVITGLEDYPDMGRYLFDESENGGFPGITIKAKDSLSGVNADDFYVKIYNSDNGSSRVWKPDGSGDIVVSFGREEAEKYFYFGDFEITVHVSDRVGNVSEQKVSGWGFDLKADIVRLLESVDGKDVFARGESGNLEIKTYGYAEQVEVVFPGIFSKYSKVFNYGSNKGFEKDETIRFMIPLYEIKKNPDSFTVTVIARKDGRTLTSHPRINVVEIEGSVLDELRTCLR